MIRFPWASPSFRRLVLSSVVLASLAAPALAAATLEEEVDGVSNGARGDRGSVVGATITLDYRVRNGKVSKPPNLPPVPGFRVDGSGSNPQSGFEEFTFFVTPLRAGDLTVPAFDIRTNDGQMLHAAAIMIHVAAH